MQTQLANELRLKLAEAEALLKQKDAEIVRFHQQSKAELVSNLEQRQLAIEALNEAELVQVKQSKDKQIKELEAKLASAEVELKNKDQ